MALVVPGIAQKSIVDLVYPENAMYLADVDVELRALCSTCIECRVLLESCVAFSVWHVW